MATQPLDYGSHHNLLETTPGVSSKTLRLALASFERPKTYSKPFSAREKAALRAGGLDPDAKRKSTSNPFAESAVMLAAIMERSLTPKEASERLGVTTSCVRRMIADRSLYSFLINRTRYIPDFQFTKNRLIPGIDKINQALDPEIHPIGVYNWFHYPNTDLFINDDIDQTVSPLEWLMRGEKPDLAEELAGFL